MRVVRQTTRLRLLAASVGTAGTLAAELILAEALMARRREYLPAESAPEMSGEFGDPLRPSIRLAMLGDSTAAGVGVIHTEESVGGLLAQGLADAGHHVVLTGVAVSGSRSGDLGPQVSRALLARPDVAVLLVGANDATHLATGRRMLAPLTEAVRRLRTAGVPVVLGCCPDLGGSRAIARPLRDLHAAVGRVVANRQATAGAHVGAVVVDLARLTGPAFRADPQTLSGDLFHPNAKGYRLWANALYPAVEQVVGVRITDRS